MPHYIFGYGSLFSQESRERTAPTPQAWLATLRTYARSWCFEDPEGYCALGITHNELAHVNGVLIRVDAAHLPHFDEREAGYVRRDVTGQVACDVAIERNAVIWTYVIETPAPPCTCHPIAQTYLDVTLTGCLEYGAHIAEEFLRTTHGWERPWAHDRNLPIFKRGLRSAPHESIDALLARHVPLSRTDLR